MASFPPIEESILQNNPKFAALHKTLTTRILNPNGSTKNHPAQAELDARAEALQKHQLTSTKRQILHTSLANLPLRPKKPTDQTLPPELTELIILLSLQLSPEAPTNLTPESRTLLTTTDLYTNTLPDSLPQIGALLSTHLHALALPLARILSPHTNPSFLHRQIANLPTHLATLQASISEKKAHLSTTRLSLIPLTTSLLTAYRQATTLTIQILEQTVHGALSRSAKARAELLALEAKEQSLKLQNTLVTARGLVYTPEAVDALRRYGEHLRDERARLKARRKDAVAELGRYGVGRQEDEDDGAGGATANKEKVMKEIARVYGEMSEEIEEVRRDLARLKGT